MIKIQIVFLKLNEPQNKFSMFLKSKSGVGQCPTFWRLWATLKE